MSENERMLLLVAAALVSLVWLAFLMTRDESVEGTASMLSCILVGWIVGRLARGV